jgi:hypothetical protein
MVGSKNGFGGGGIVVDVLHELELRGGLINGSLLDVTIIL